MFMFIYRALQGISPYFTLPFAAIIGVAGYNLENYLSDKYTPASESIEEKRNERLISDEQLDKTPQMGYTNVLTKNVSPSLQN